MENILKQANTLNMVYEFHNIFGQPILNEITIPDKERCKLRISLIQEELNELQAAIDNNDIIEVADAFADLEYVLMWSVLEFWLWWKFGEIFEAVHSSNMSKLCDTVKQAEETIAWYIANKWWSYTYKQKWNKFVVYRDDGKVIKSIYYKPVDIKNIIL